MASHFARTISVESIELGPIPFDLYASEGEERIVLFCRAGFEITARHKRMLKGSDRILYISSSDIEQYLDYSFERIEHIVANPRIDVSEKAQIVHGVGKRVVQQLLNNPRSGDAMAHSSRFVRSHVSLILKSPASSDHLFALSSTDPYTFSHSINVCTFCLLLGEKLFGRDHKQLRQIGLGGLLHDIGKIRIDPSVLFKPSALTPEEWAEVRRHSDYGYETGKEHGLPETVLSVIRSHHERMDGSGYPDGLGAGGIPTAARICAVADVYDALTSDRFYAKSMPHVQALVEIAKQIDSLDSTVFDALLQIVLRNEKLIERFHKRRLSLPKRPHHWSKRLHQVGKSIISFPRRLA